MLAVVETHPVQYHAPVYRCLQEKFNIPVTVIYGSDFSVKGFYDREFKESFAWDINLLSGYTSIFLSQNGRSNVWCNRKNLLRGLRGELAKLQPRAVLLNGYSGKFYQKVFYECWRQRLPIFFRGETTDHAQRRGILKSWCRDFALQWIYSFCEKLFYIGIRSKKHFERLKCLKERLVFSPYCVDISHFNCSEVDRKQFRERGRMRLNLKETDIVLLFSGKLSRRKGVDLIGEAIKQLPEDLRKRTVILYLGNGEMRQWLESQAKKDPAVRVIFAGFQNQSQLSLYYHSSDLLILPSRHSETWGLVVNEALHHGLPCVVSEAVGCAPDLIEPGVTGEICESNSVQSLTQTILKSMRLIGHSEIRDECRKKTEGYTVEKAAEGIALGYLSVKIGER